MEHATTRHESRQIKYLNIHFFLLLLFQLFRLTFAVRPVVAHSHMLIHCVASLFARWHDINSYIIFDFCIISLIYIEIESTKLRSAHICRFIFHFISAKTPPRCIQWHPHNLLENIFECIAIMSIVYILYILDTGSLTRASIAIRFGGGGGKVKQLFLSCVTNGNISSAWFISWAFVINIIRTLHAKWQTFIYVPSINIFIVSIINTMCVCLRALHTHSDCSTTPQTDWNKWTSCTHTDSSVAAKAHTRNYTHRIDHMRNDNANDGNERNKTEKSGENEKQRCDRNIRYTWNYINFVITGAN